jgi:exonuclease VII small subunit
VLRRGILGSLYTRSSIETTGYHRGTMGWRREIRDVIAQLEQQRSRLEEVRERAKRQGGPEGERLEAQATARLREIEQRIADLRTSLE